MGEVLRAHDLQMDRPVALKRFRLGPGKKDDRLRFRREFHTLARLAHPRIVEVYDYGVDDGKRPFYTMELLDGSDFSEQAPLPWPRACGLLRDVASALAFLHARQLLHRDIAPRNVRCTEDGRAKLLDFGMLATMGISHEVVGTLPSIPPEMLLGLPMDGRADLFGLGALAFWLLTGRHPQRVRSLEDLMRNGRRPPPLPSSIVPEIPAALDDLVLSLLSPEPLGRPSLAAEVIDRLGAIGELPPAPKLEAAHGYVRSAGLVGREREMELARKRIERAVDGHGGSILIEARSGMGKTRLLREIELEAKLAGASVLHGEGGAAGPYALVRELARQLERRGRRNNSAQHAALVDRLLPDPTAETGDASERAGRDHREDRAAVQAAFGDWLVAFAAHRPLVLVLDNLQRADEGSAAVLAGLSHIAPDRSLLLVGALRSDETSHVGGALSHLRARATVLRPRGLGREEVTALVANTFGAVDNHASFGAWLHKTAGGSPLHCTELVRSLVERGELRYAEGFWDIPQHIDAEGLPQALEQTLDTRIDALPPAALALAQSLAVHGHETGLALCVALAHALSEQQVFAAIDTLVREEIIIGAGERYRLRHDGLREALLRSLDTPQREALELHVGETLAADGSVSAEHEAQIGWHLLRGGDRERGSKILSRAGRRLFEATSFEDCVAPLEAALAVFQDQEPRSARVAEIAYMLVAAGFYCDREVNERHRDRAITALAHHSGIARASRWSRWLGRRLGLGLAVLTTIVQRVFDRRRIPFVTALDFYLRAVVYSAGTSGFSFDTESLRQRGADLDAVRSVRHLFVRTAVGLVDNLLHFNLGRIATLLESSARNLAGMGNQRRWLSAEERAITIGGSRFQRALVAARVGNLETLDEIEALEQLGPRIWTIGGLQARTYYHLWRGETAAAARIWKQAELEFVRLGSLWQLYAIHHSSAALTYGYTDDMLGLRRCIEALDRQVASGLGFSSYLALAKAEHARLRGENTEALSLIDEALALLPEGEGMPRPWALTARIDVLLAAGRLDEAAQAGQRALAHAADPEFGQGNFRCRAQRSLALVEAAKGNHAAASARLDALIEDALIIDNPFILGAAHEARAEVAAAMGQPNTAREHADRVEACFVPTRNPVLVARYERLLRHIGTAPQPSTADPSSSQVATAVFEPQTQGHTIGDAISLLSACRTADERAEQALATLRESVGASAGFLFLLHEGEPLLVAPSAGAEPPTGVSDAVRERLATVMEITEEGTTLQHARSGWVHVLLFAEIEDRERVVGAVVLRIEPPGRMPPSALRLAIGQRLYEEGDVSLRRDRTA
ncbi:MAG: AAA family ATPase [Deltaproteobacteria bacterium]|nr:AAA family ATPase [Deltaproteobacteria bacterium]